MARSAIPPIHHNRDWPDFNKAINADFVYVLSLIFFHDKYDIYLATSMYD